MRVCAFLSECPLNPKQNYVRSKLGPTGRPSETIPQNVARAKRSRFVRWEMELEGIPVTQAATLAFEAGLAAAISSETGNYALENSTVLVRGLSNTDI